MSWDQLHWEFYKCDPFKLFKTYYLVLYCKILKLQKKLSNLIKILFYPHQYRQVSHTTSKSNYVKLRKWTSLHGRYSCSGLKLKVSLPPPHQHVAVSCLIIVYSYLHIQSGSASDDIVSFSFQWYCWYWIFFWFKDAVYSRFKIPNFDCNKVQCHELNLY